AAAAHGSKPGISSAVPSSNVRAPWFTRDRRSRSRARRKLRCSPRSPPRARPPSRSPMCARPPAGRARASTLGPRWRRCWQPPPGEPLPDTALVSLTSEGVILVYGRDEQAIEAARLLENRLDVTVLLNKPRDIAPARVTTFPVVAGTIRAAKGYLGAFELTV